MFILGNNDIKVCFFGFYFRDYNRNIVLIKGLEKNGVLIRHCNAVLPLLKSPISIIKSFSKLVRCSKIISSCDVIFSAYPAWLSQPLAKLFSKFKNKPLIYDAFISIYDTAVYDKKEVDKDSLLARYYFYQDRILASISDLVILDTNAHIRYFSRVFDLPISKFRRVLVGADDELFYPINVEKENTFDVMFWGTYLPLHGLEYIIEAAKIVEKEKNIVFHIIGKGPFYLDILRLAKKFNVKNVKFIDPIPFEKLPKYLAYADLCLGIFGTSGKARRVIPNKVYEALAMKKPIITGDTVGAREILSHKNNSYLVKIGNAEAIADAILELRDNTDLRMKIAENGYKLFKEKLTPKAIGKEFKRYICEAIERSYS